MINEVIGGEMMNELLLDNGAEATTKRMELRGLTWYPGRFQNPTLDIDAVVRPLGLAGTFKVLGIDGERRHRGPVREEEFDVTLTPEMTPLHLMGFAALEHERRNPDSIPRFEGLEVRPADCVIEFFTQDRRHREYDARKRASKRAHLRL